MTHAVGDLRDEARYAESRDALEFILSEHLKHRSMCKVLERLAAAAAFEPELIARMADFIRYDLTLHVIDEEEDFFPLLRRRCWPEDNIGPALDRMTAEHAADKSLSIRVRGVLNACLIERKPAREIAGAAQALRDFAHHERRHLTLENAVIVPLARRRLNAADLAHLGERFLARRQRLAATAEGR